jgi:hypothetical protein
MPLLAVTYLTCPGGATTVTLGLAAAASTHTRPVVVECAPTGGSLMYRHDLAARPSIVDLAAAARGTTTPEEVFTTAGQPLRLRLGDAELAVVPAPAGGAQTRAALPELTGTGRSVLTASGRLLVADCGRLHDGSPVWPLLGLADAVVVLARARPDDLAHLVEHLPGLVDTGAARLVVALTPGGTHSPADVAEVVTTQVDELAGDPDAVAVVGPLPHDPGAAAILDGRLAAGRRWRRLPLIRALDRLLPLLLAPAPAAARRHRLEAP